MSVISKRFAEELNDKRMRDVYLSAQTRTKLVNQIRALREQRGWSQGEFAARLGKPQSNVSRLENREYGNFTLKTLFELANEFDVGLVVEFAAYDEFLRRTHDLSSSRLQVPNFSATALEVLSREPDIMPSEAIGATLFADAIHQQGSCTVSRFVAGGTNALQGGTATGQLFVTGGTNARQGGTAITGFGSNTFIMAPSGSNAVITAMSRPTNTLRVRDASSARPQFSGALPWSQEQVPAQRIAVIDTDIECATDTDADIGTVNTPVFKLQTTQTSGLTSR